MEIGSGTETSVEHPHIDTEEGVSDHAGHQKPIDKRLVVDTLEYLINSLPDFAKMAIVRRTTQEYDYLQVFDRTPDWGHLNLLQLVLRGEGHQIRIQLLSCGQGGQRVIKESVSICNIYSPISELKLFLETYFLELTAGRYQGCQGAFHESELVDLTLLDLKKTLIEKNSSGLENTENTFSYRSRDCKYLQQEGDNFCGPCIELRQSVTSSFVAVDNEEEITEKNANPESIRNEEDFNIIDQRIDMNEELFPGVETGGPEFSLGVAETVTPSDTQFDPLITGGVKEEIHSPLNEQLLGVSDMEMKNFVEINNGGFWGDSQDIAIKSEVMENEMTIDSDECEVNVSILPIITGKDVMEYECDKCDHIATTRRNLLRHQQSVHEGVKYDCDKCDFKATLRAGLKRHKQSVHEGVKYNCDQCGYRATQRGDLRKHERSVHEGVKYGCDQCDFKAAQRGYLRTHQLAVHEGVQYNCDRCDYTATKRRNLQRHKLSVHKGIGYNGNKLVNGELVREELNKSLNDTLTTGGVKEDFQSHLNEDLLNVSVGEMQSFVEVNDEGFLASRQDIEMKIEEDFINANGRENEWPVQSFESELKVTDESTQSDRLPTHHQSVPEGWPFICDKCNYKATSRHNLLRHQQSIHERVKFGCDKCDFKAARKDSLQRHQQSVHEGVKYNCDKCDYQATQRVYLRNHQRSIHEGVQYNCEQCEFIGFTSGLLQKHQQAEHKGVRDDAGHM